MGSEWIGLIGALAGTLLGAVLGFADTRQRARERIEDARREDALREQAQRREDQLRDRELRRQMYSRLIGEIDALLEALGMHDRGERRQAVTEAWRRIRMASQESILMSPGPVLEAYGFFMTAAQADVDFILDVATAVPPQDLGPLKSLYQRLLSAMRADLKIDV